MMDNPFTTEAQRHRGNPVFGFARLVFLCVLCVSVVNPVFAKEAAPLAADPVVLLLDEPSAGVAQRETEALGPLLLRIRDHTGCAMLVIEHDMPLLAGICDQMVALELGRPIAWGTPETVLADERVISSYLGTDAAAIGRSGATPTPVPT